MSDKRGSVSIRMSKEVQDELKALIDGYDEGTAGDFIELLIQTYKANNSVSETSMSDMRELNLLTSRIYSIYQGISERNEVIYAQIKQDYESKLSETTSMNDELLSMQTVNEQKIKSLESNVNSLNSEMAKLKRENDRLKKDSDKNDKIISGLEDKLKDYHKLKNENSNLTAGFDGVEFELNEAKDDCKRLEQSLILEKERYSNLKQEHERQLNMFRRENEMAIKEELYKQRDEYRDMINKKDEVIAKLKDEEYSLKVELNDLRDKIREMSLMLRQYRENMGLENEEKDTP